MHVVRHSVPTCDRSVTLGVAKEGYYNTPIGEKQLMHLNQRFLSEQFRLDMKLNPEGINYLR